MCEQLYCRAGSPSLTCDLAKVSTTPCSTADAAVAAKAEAAACRFCDAALAEAVAVAEVMASVCPEDLATENDWATAGVGSSNPKHSIGTVVFWQEVVTTWRLGSRAWANRDAAHKKLVASCKVQLVAHC